MANLRLSHASRVAMKEEGLRPRHPPSRSRTTWMVGPGRLASRWGAVSVQPPAV